MAKTKLARARARACDETLVLCRFFTILHEAVSLHTTKPARRRTVSVVPLEIKSDVGMCPEARTRCITPEIVHIAFHGAIEPAYHTAPATILCRHLAGGLNSLRPFPRLVQSSSKNRTSKV